MPRLTDGDPERRACEFISRLYQNADSGYLEIRCLKFHPDRCCISNWFPIAAGMSAYSRAYEYALQANRDGFDVFFGVNPRVNGGRADSDILAGVATWVDIDGIPTASEAEVRLAQIEGPVPPDMAVFSGGGLHVYWVLSETYDPADESFALYRGALRQAAGFYGGDSKSTNISRVLRFPLSYSHKRGCFTKLWLRGEE